jgi:hypothetical protein
MQSFYKSFVLVIPLLPFGETGGLPIQNRGNCLQQMHYVA